MDANTVLKKMRVTIECLLLGDILIAAGTSPKQIEQIYENLVDIAP